MPAVLFVISILTLAASVLVFIVGPSAIQEIGGCILWCGGWLILAASRIVSRLDQPFGVYSSTKS